MLFYLWSNKYGKWWRAGAWGYSEDIRERGHFNASDAMRFLINGTNDPQWTSQNDEPKTLALGEDGRWYSLVEYDGETPPTDPVAQVQVCNICHDATCDGNHMTVAA